MGLPASFAGKRDHHVCALRISHPSQTHHRRQKHVLVSEIEQKTPPYPVCSIKPTTKSAFFTAIEQEAYISAWTLCAESLGWKWKPEPVPQVAPDLEESWDCGTVDIQAIFNHYFDHHWSSALTYCKEVFPIDVLVFRDPHAKEKKKQEEGAASEKYWAQRRKLFTLFNDGIQMDEEGWYSVTPEAIAIHTAHRLECPIVIDAFCGVGGNSIQLAKTCSRVIAIDIDPNRLAMARHNAHVYGVADRIEWVLGDFLSIGLQLKADAVFLSPPWGGPAYLHAATFDLATMKPNLGQIMKVSQAITPNVALFLPRNTDLVQIATFAPLGATVEIEQNYLDGKVKALTAYFGGLVGCR